MINKRVSFFLQIIGGLLILFSIDSNIGIIKEKTLFSIFANYLREFPLIKRSVVIKLQGTANVTIGTEAKITVVRNPKNIEEKIEYLQEQINVVKRDLEQTQKELNEKINRQSKEIIIQNQEVKSVLRNFESKMDKVSVGGIKAQLFGVLLMLYGAIAGYMA